MDMKLNFGPFIGKLAKRPMYTNIKYWGNIGIIFFIFY